MKTSAISTAALWNAPRANIARMETDLARLNTELVTGRVADVGLKFGAATVRATTLHIDIRAFSATIESNGIAASRLQNGEAALANLASDAETFLNELITARNTETPIGEIARARLDDFLRVANASDGRNHLFAGINSAEPPLRAFETAAMGQLDAAFLATFGFARNDPQVAQIGGAAMTGFLNNAFAALFADPDWGTGWSTASDQVIRAHISPNEVIDTSVSINEPATRKLAMVYSMVAHLGVEAMSDEARTVLLDKAIGIAGEAMSGLTELRSKLGLAGERVEAATERLRIQSDVLQQQVARLEGVDTAETKVKIDTLMTQIEMSYALTARIMKLSILNYA